jgi:hypothetical protein
MGAIELHFRHASKADPDECQRGPMVQGARLRSFFPALVCACALACSNSPAPDAGAAGGSAAGGSAAGGGGSTSNGGGTGGGSSSVGGGSTSSGGGTGGGTACTGTLCGSDCADLNSDSAHCGNCNHACNGGAFCAAGVCHLSSDCTAGPNGPCELSDAGLGTCCDGTCEALDVMNDPNACGGCGLHCPVTSACASGACLDTDGGFLHGCAGSTCGPGLTCNTPYDRCLAATCTPALNGEQCNGPGESLCCGGSCTNVYTDPAHCGACDHPCGANEFCNSGVCAAIVACSPTVSGATCLEADGGIGGCCDGACVDRYRDVNNCEYCGAVCSANEVCAGGCKMPDAGFPGMQTCDGPCPNGWTCSQGRCLRPTCAPGSSGDLCAFGNGIPGECCNGACVNLSQDPLNCTQCGRKCPSTAPLCQPTGLYGAPPVECLVAPGAASCFPACAGGQFCVQGVCLPTTCTANGGVCQATNGEPGVCCGSRTGSGGITCAALFSDRLNCGACGVSCNGGTCTQGICSTTPAQCAPGHNGQFCNLDAGFQYACCSGAGCVDTGADVRNCGACNNACLPMQSCVGGGCYALTCTAATERETCLDDAGTSGHCCSSSCIHGETDPLNCGGCGIVCDAGQTCVQSNCQ